MKVLKRSYYITHPLDFLSVIENGFSSKNSLLRRRALNLDSLNLSNEDIIRAFRVSYLSLVNGFLKIFVTRHVILLS